MGLGTSEDIKLKIEGTISYNYEDTLYAPDIFRKELELLCARYGLEVTDEGDK